MEKIIAGFGFGIVCISFFLSICVGTQFIWGVLIGMVPMYFGRFFFD